MKTHGHHLHPTYALATLLRLLGLARAVRLPARIPLPCATRPRRRLSARFDLL
jgi:hypothetical protein